MFAIRPRFKRHIIIFTAVRRSASVCKVVCRCLSFAFANRCLANVYSRIQIALTRLVFHGINDHARVYLVLQIPIFVSCRSGPLQIWSLLTLHVVYLTRRTSRAPIMPLCCRDHEYNCSRRTHACLFIVNSLFSLIFIIEQIDPAFALGPSRSLYASIT